VNEIQPAELAETKQNRLCRNSGRRDLLLNPYPANIGEYGELLIMPADGRWDL